MGRGRNSCAPNTVAQFATVVACKPLVIDILKNLPFSRFRPNSPELGQPNTERRIIQGREF
jgi:hypothetical protein